ncbi:unnamed protein product [Rotaria sp. Silwood1]|nr:unnamed protein product [Rotaria sp. Silwood1]
MYKKFLVILFLCVFNVNTYQEENDDDFIDIGVRLTGDNRDYLIADLIAEEKNLFNAGHISGIGLHHFRIQRKHGRRSKRALDDAIEDLKHDERIEYVTIAESLERQKREFINDDELEELYKKYRHWKHNQSPIDMESITDNSSFKMSFDDTYYKKQWYLVSIRLLDGRITTLLEARALTLFAANTSIKSASWGPTDDGTKMEAPGALVNAALDYGVTHGRQGKGTLFVWASGNGGTAGDDCGADGYVSHPNVISIGSINHLGKTTYFGEFCPSTMAVAYTGGRHARSIREPFIPVGVVAADVGGKCTTKFFGTSGAAPVAAGALALVLEANPELTYRDIMHIIAETARIPNLSETDDWMINGAGFHVSDKFGFGVLDVGQMIALAQNWTNVNPRYDCYHEYKGSPVQLTIGASVEVNIDVDKCENVTNLEHVQANVSFSFHRRGDVKVTLISPSGTLSEMISYRDNDASKKGIYYCLQIEMYTVESFVLLCVMSLMNTSVHIYIFLGIKYFPFMSAHKWGESPIGRWTLRIETRTPQNDGSMKSAIDDDTGELNYFGLRLYGSYSSNDEKNNIQKRQESNAFIPTHNELEWIYKRELSIRESPNVMQKRDYQNLINERQRPKENSDQSLFSTFRKTFGF